MKQKYSYFCIKLLYLVIESLSLIVIPTIAILNAIVAMILSVASFYSFLIQFSLVCVEFFESIAKLKTWDEIRWIGRTNQNLPIKPNQSNESHIREKNKTRAGKTRKIRILFSSSLSSTREFQISNSATPSVFWETGQ